MLILAALSCQVLFLVIQIRFRVFLQRLRQFQAIGLDLGLIQTTEIVTGPSDQTKTASRGTRPPTHGVVFFRPSRHPSRQPCRLGVQGCRQPCRLPCRHGLWRENSRLAPFLISKTVSEIQISRNLLWALNGSYGLRFSKTRTLFRVFFRDERNGIARFT